MIKKVIFDLDNTLIKWEDRFIFALVNTIKELNLDYDEDMINKIDNAIVSYSKHHNIYTKEMFCDYINKECNINLPYEFYDILKEQQTNCYRQFTENEIDTLKYLSSKYELIILSNWLTYTQTKRLEKSGILKYFSLVSGGDERELKPSIKAFDIIDNKEECVMIGDDINNDILPAISVGMQAILLTNKNVRKDLRYRQAKRLEDLKEML